ncbi:FG-GAP-like repeat-containing protein [Nocardioides sp. BP30]|uniref:FG-GAP-like repeat-containing protein n=1 Tax=Nocardioides sp. BP30 TaxID=3036374 RepID=UPI0024698779|nr:FG-GAP-like repeat-containing protein [Nocardioides sp. BP30]WGL51519.1 FG-GAP-like repeat-containing protein [Nocardioides sp. BP30]
MHLGKIRYVASCQQLLVLGVVVAALVPAASVVTLDVVRETPSETASTGGSGSVAPAIAPTPSGALAAYTKAALTPSTVATAPAEASVKEIQLTVPSAAVAGRRAVNSEAAAAARNARVATTARRTTITSTPQRVTGFGTVGVTWEHGDDLKPSQVRVRLRTEKNGTWSGWKKVDYDVDGPDPSSSEGRRSRPGTMEALVGHVDQVQVRMRVIGVDAPPDLKLAVIAPGATPTAAERPALDTSKLDEGSGSSTTTAASAPAAAAAPAAPAAAPAAPAAPAVAPAAAGGAVTDATDATDASLTASAQSEAVLAAAAYTPKPQIYSRAQWGADEKIREQTAPSYAEVHGGFVHHTVNANDYTAAEVPGIIRSIYAYHVRSRGWRDIGYNFLIDKFGRIWEGRYGGVDRPVVGAHTENYNDYGFGVSAIGNFETGKPTTALLQAEGALFAWKLSLHGVSAAATNVTIGPKTFASSIMGHRDTKATACPGKYLYAQIPQIRTIAASLQKGWSGRTLESSFLGNSDPDIVVRDATSKEVYVVPTTPGASRSVAVAAVGAKQSVTSGDLTGDRRVDLVTVSKKGVAKVRPGDGAGHYGTAVTKDAKKFVGRAMVTAVGDLNGDGHNDLVAKIMKAGKNRGRLSVYLGRGNGTFVRKAQPTVDLSDVTGLAGPGDITGDGHPDLLARHTNGTIVTLPGTGTGAFGAPRASSSGRLGTPIDTGLKLPNATQLLNAGDWNRDGHSDLITRNTDGNLYLYLGNGQGRFAKPTVLAGGFGAVTLLSAAGDITGDGWPDLQGQVNGAMRIWPGKGAGGLATSYVSHSAISAKEQVAVGRWNGDGAPDALFVKGKKTLLYPGNGPGGLTNPITVGGSLTGYSWVIGVGNVQGTGRSALILRNSAGALYQISPTATGTLGAPQLLGTGFSRYDLAG